MARISNASLSGSQMHSLREAELAVRLLHSQEVGGLDHGEAVALAEPESDAASDTDYILAKPSCALRLNETQITFLSQKFFPLLVLLKSLNDIRGRPDRTEAESPPPSDHQTPEQKFCIFVDKLSQICDYGLNGKSFTACVVLEEPDGVLYLLASNDRNKKELEDMRAKLVVILRILKENIIANTAERKSDDELSDSLLRLLLANHKRKVDCYLAALSKALKECVEVCKYMGEFTGRELSTASPNHWIEKLAKAKGNKHTGEEILGALHCLLRATQSMKKGAINAGLAESTLDGSSPTASCAETDTKCKNPVRA